MKRFSKNIYAFALKCYASSYCQILLTILSKVLKNMSEICNVYFQKIYTICMYQISKKQVNICNDYINKASHTEYYLDENSRNFLMYTLRCDEEAEIGNSSRFWRAALVGMVLPQCDLLWWVRQLDAPPSTLHPETKLDDEYLPLH
jgi:hypothetical protein